MFSRTSHGSSSNGDEPLVAHSAVACPDTLLALTSVRFTPGSGSMVATEQRAFDRHFAV